MKTRPLEDVTPVITAQELADWLNVDAADSLIEPLISMATSAAIDYTQLEFINRSREVTYTDWPIVGSDAIGLSPSNATYDVDVIIPYAGLQSVTSVNVFGGAVTEYQVKANTPSQIRFNIGVINKLEGEDAIKIEYIAGFGGINDVPEVIKLGVLNLAAYLYEMRGGCDINDAIKMSGAAFILKPYKTNLVAM